MTHYVFSAAHGAWWTRLSGWSSDVKQAQPFSREEALAFCLRRNGPAATNFCFPVLTEDLLAVLK